jgi:hypothetical protein
LSPGNKKVTRLSFLKKFVIFSGIFQKNNPNFLINEFRVFA